MAGSRAALTQRQMRTSELPSAQNTPGLKTSRKLAWLGVIAFGLLCLTALLAVRYPLNRGLLIPRATWVSLVQVGWSGAALHIGIYLGLTLLYTAALRLLAVAPPSEPSAMQGTASRRGWQSLIILSAWLVCVVILMTASPGGESSDIFDYVFRGRMMVEYEGNPLADIPKSYSQAPYYRYLAWYKNVDTYGPVWETASAVVASGVRQAARSLGWWGENLSCPKSIPGCRLLAVYLTGYRLMATVLVGLSGWVIATIVKYRRPAWLAAALAAWLWCPLVLVAASLGGHNDALMIVFLLAGAWLLQRRHATLGLLALILAAHVKLTALIWAPTFGLWIVWRWGWKRALQTILISAGLGVLISWLLYMPYDGWQTLPKMLHERSLYLANSIWRVINTLMIDEWGLRVNQAHLLTTNLATWLFAAGAVLVSLWMFNFRPRCWQRMDVSPAESERILWKTLVIVSMLYLTVGSFWFQHWYILWVIWPAALLPGSRFTRSILPWVVFGALSANVGMNFLSFEVLKSAPVLYKNTAVIAITWGPALIAAGLAAVSWRLSVKKQKTLAASII